MDREKVPERELKVQRLVEYLSHKSDGEAVGYIDIEREIGMEMREPAQRRLLVVALRRLKRLWIMKYGWGVIISSADNAADISASRVRKVRGAVNRLGRASTNLLLRHGEEMTQYNRNVLIQDAALAGALKTLVKAHHVKREALKGEKPPAPMLPSKV